MRRDWPAPWKASRRPISLNVDHSDDDDPGVDLAVRVQSVNVDSPADLAVARKLSRTRQDQVAQAGGTNAAFIVDTNQNVTQQFIDALNEIRASGQCQLQIPVPTSGTPDYGKVNVFMAGLDGTEAPIGQVTSSAACPGDQLAWYYDDPNSPTRGHLCPLACETVFA